MMKNSRPNKSTRRNLLLSKLEDRILFDAAMDAGLDPSAGDVNAMSSSADSLQAFEQDVSAYEENGAIGDAASDVDSQNATVTRHELVIVDTSVDDYQLLVEDLLSNVDEGRSIEVMLLDAESNGVEQVSAILAQYDELDALHLVTHGDDAAFSLGNTWVNAGNLEGYAGQIAQWGDSLNANGDILLYGCDLAESAAGRELVDSLAALTNSDVAASTDDTGNAYRGGDWDLEYRRGTLESTVVFSQQLQDSYRGLLLVGPEVSFATANQDVPIGEDFQFTVTFDNTEADTGYGPFVDLIIPFNGIDGAAGTDTPDGIDFVGATYLGQALNTIEFTFPDDGGGVGVVDHPFALDASGDPLQITGTAGDKLVVIELPFGSYTADQPSAAIVVTANTSNLADLAAPLTIQTRSGFRFGSDPLDNPTSDPSIMSDSVDNVTDPSGAATSWTEQMTITPTLMELTKIYLGPEDETATGPNHIQQYQIDIDIADGQTISNLDIIESLPNNVVVTSIDSVTVNGSAAAYTDNLGSLTFPGNGLDLTVTPNSSVTGTTSATDVSVTISFYVTEFDADGDRVIPMNGEDDTISNPDSRSFNNARAVGDWTPIDSARDAGGTDNAIADPDPVNEEHLLDDKAIAIQKSVAIVNNVGATGANPGDTLQYTLNFQISDYYTFGDLIIDDVFQDGQLFDFTYGATFTVTDMNGTVTGNFTVRSVADADGGQTLVVDETDIDRLDDVGEVGSGASDGSDGTTTLRFDLSQVMQDNGAADGVLQGGLSDGATNGGAATGTITFRTVIQDEYADTFASGDRSVDQGDVITNSNLQITGSVRDNAEDGLITNAIYSESDDSSASITIATGTLIKDVYAINGNTTLPTGPSGKVSLTPGDIVTYRIQYTVPTSDFENLKISDFLPLPIFDVTDHNGDGVVNAADNWTFNLGGSFDGTAPASGVIEFGANDTFYGSNAPDSNIIPTITLGSSNELELTYGNYDDPASQSSVIELYFSITAKSEPTADGLFLTNIVRAAEGTTQLTPTVLDQIVQIEVLQPELNITKGIVSSDSATAVYDSTIGPAGISFGTAGTADPLFSGGVINSTALASQRINANITGGVDAGDRIRYAVVLENTGNTTRGAYDVTITDSLPTGFTLVGGSVQIVDGTGATVSYSGTEADLFNATGIVLDDPGATADTGDGTNSGAIDGYDATDGRNVVIVFYDVTADASVEAAETYTNTAVIENYAGQEGGENHAASRPSDDADVRVDNVEVTKSIVSTSESHTTVVGGTERVTIGEIVRYQVQVALPEGSLTGLQVRDVLPSGLTFIDDGTATVNFISDGVGITSSAVTSGVLPDSAISRNSGSESDNYDTGRDVYFKLGNIDNNDRDTNIEYAVIEFNVLVDNNNVSSSARNDVGESRFNDVFVYTNGSLIYDMPQGNRPEVIVAEPLVQNINKAGSISTGDAGDSITYTVTFDVATGNSRSDAFNVRLLDTLPSDMTLGAITSVTVGGSAATYTGGVSGNTIDIELDRVNKGQAVVVVYTATIDLTVSPEDVLANTANVTWSSLPGDFGTANGSGGNSTGSDLASLDGLTTGVGTDGVTYDTDTGSLHGERDGSDGTGNNPNDYATADTHNVTIDGITTFTKTLVRTEFDDAFNGATDAVIGELVTYQLTVTFPEGTTPNAMILDTLDNGLAFVGQTASSLDDVAITGSLTPTISGNGRTVTWDFGTVTDSNLANNTDGSITVEYQAVVLNVTGNQAGTALDNSAVFSWNNDPATELTRDAVDVVVREAHVEVTKSVDINAPSGASTGDAGDPVQYTIVIQNTGGYDAFDVTFSDTLPTVGGGTSAILGATFSVVDTLGGGLTASDFTLSGDDANGYSLSLNGGVDLDLLKSEGARTITVTVSGTITSNVGPNEIIANTANAQWTSLDGDVTSRSAITTDDDGERDGTNPADDTHDYDDAGTASFMINPPVFNKSLFSTDQTETSGSDVTIGEKVTYALLVSLPEGVTAGMAVVDLLPPGLNYESSQLITTVVGSGGLLTADFNGTITGGNPVVTGGALDGDDVTFTFGQIDVTEDNAATNNSFVILITAAVSDVATNIGYNPGQTTLTNTATIDIVGDTVGPLSSNGVDVDVTESNLVITKDIDKTLADATELLTITLRIDNNGLGDAYDVVLSDVLTDAIYDLSSLSVGASGTDYPADFLVTAVSGASSVTLGYSGGTIAAGSFVEFTFAIELNDTVLPGATLVNTANVTNASTLEGTVAGERDDPDPDGDNSDTDNDSVTIRSNSLAGNVYFDANNDGVFGGTENGIFNVGVRLRGTDHLGNNVDIPTNTLADGSYLFDDLRPGTYRITETQPTTALNGKDYLDGTDTIGTPGGNASVNDDFTNIVLPTGVETDGTNNNFGELEEAELSGFVWHDADNDGVKDGGEPGIGGVGVTLSGTNDVGAITPVTISTNPDGSYTFDGLRPGQYTITETQPTFPAPSGRDYADGIDVDGSLANGVSANEVTSSIDAAAGDTGINYNFGEVVESAISGYVYHDSDNDGSRGGETGIELVDITLTGFDDLGNVINLSTQTDINGYYEFAGLRPAGASGYTLTQSTPTGYLDGMDTIGTPGGNDTVNDVFSSINVTSDSNGTENNFGELLPASIAGKVFNDHNNDGIQQAGEPGIGGVELTLSGRNDLGAITPITVTTNPDGTYSISGLRPSDSAGYTLIETQPSNYNDGMEVDGSLANGDVTSDNVNTGINIVSGDNGTGYDFAERGTSISGTVYVDEDRNGGLEPGETDRVNGVLIELYDSSGTVLIDSMTTGTNGNYQFDHLPADDYVIREIHPAQYSSTTPDTINATLPLAGLTDQDFGENLWDIGDFVWFDTNGDGNQDLGEPGLEGIGVTLTYAGLDGDFTTAGDNVVSNTTTNGSGAYSFEDLFNGNYRVTIAGVDLPTGIVATAEVDDTSAAVDGTSNVIVGGSDRFDVDFGYTGTGSVGDTVFWDQDNSGTFDSGEIGLAGVVVELDIDFDGNGSVDLTLSTTTDGDGEYLFERIPAGNHVVRVTRPSGTTQTFDSDGLGVGSENQSTVGLTAGENNQDQDFGYRGTGSIGDTVFFDQAGDGGAFNPGANDFGLPGVRVTLEIDVDGNGSVDLTRTQTTGANGDYLFENLIAGDYKISLVAADLPAALENHATVDRDGTLNHETDVTLADGQNVTNADFGYYATPEYEVIKTDDVVGAATPGLTFNYFLQIINHGDMDGTGVVVTDNLPISVLDGTSVVTDDPTNVVYNPLTGNLVWNAGDLGGLGGTKTLQVTVTVQDPVNVLLTAFDNTATVTDDGSRGPDPIPGNNTSTDPVSLVAVPDYEIEKTSSLTETAMVGDSFFYTIRVSNIGDQDGTGVVVTDQIPVSVLDRFNVTTSDQANVSYDSSTGELIWNVGDLDGRGDTRTLTVFVEIPYVVEDPLADLIINTATVSDDGTNGPEDRLDNNSSTVEDDVLVFAFDSFTNLSKDERLGHHWGYSDSERELSPLPVDPIFSGLAEPGTTLSLKIYDAEGNIIGQRQVVADSGGNWLANFPNTIIWKHPHRMDVQQTAPIQSDVSALDGFNMRRYFHPATHHSLFFTERLTVSSVMRNSAYQTIESMHEANNGPLQVGWRNHLYQLNVSSTNASAD